MCVCVPVSVGLFSLPLRPMFDYVRCADVVFYCFACSCLVSALFFIFFFSPPFYACARGCLSLQALSRFAFLLTARLIVLSFFFRKYSVFSFARADGAGGIRYHCNGEANKRNHSRVTPASSSSSTAFSPPQKTILRER